MRYNLRQATGYSAWAYITVQLENALKYLSAVFYTNATFAFNRDVMIKARKILKPEILWA
jgi:hypothetical protein